MEQVLPQPEVKVKDVKDSLQVHEVSDDRGRGKGPAGLATQPVQGQGLITTELTRKLHTENGKVCRCRMQHWWRKLMSG